ncbi:carbohydrate ABC transporter permease [Microlunatus soli]|uniref:Carbohydrate ABC transporter membrane protein 1, CUT1 family n=1 Tax=Microlunatus soli TaxID=630515 RepID=A0A1H1T6M2_9ACTN|nr:sugar ABC transporter permease [Microlunatus soli]SDS55814.1 carbohydrate ABC transporter membrane protein 1, CUT1 family [Microlunatus soli]
MSARRQLRPPTGLPWILPALVLAVGLIYYCIGYTGFVSTLDWDGVSADPARVGLSNYSRIIADPIFWKALWHTVIFFVVTFGVQTLLGVLFAVLLHSSVRLGVVYKVLIFIPVVLAPAIMAPVFRQIFAPDGEFNWVLEHIGLGFLTQPWIGQPSTALPVIMAITIWQWTGVTFVLYFAAMGQIDSSTLEAARIDGAGNFRVLVSIIWPGVRGTTLALAILAAIGALKTFDVPYLVTIGGPNYATEFLGTYIYRMTIPQAHVGYGAALSIILLVVALVIAIGFQIRGREREVPRV